MELRQTMCCGVHEFYGLNNNNPEDILRYIGRWRRTNNNRVPFIIFTDVIGLNGGDELRNYINDNNLGMMFVTRGRRNPNSGNRVRVMVWQINKRGFRAWYREHFPRNNNEQHGEQV